MNKDNVKGKMNDIKGRVKRQVGEWTGDENAQAEGTMDQVKGKVQNAWGNVKEGVKDVGRRDREREHREDIHRDRDAA
jgi:uncharacterized protein YjbJ (UPF0337 family)